MFEFSFIRKYLTPQKKQLSISLIALLSVTVITLVVWLVVLFLSVTEGIERGWLQKLTTLNAPLHLVPSKEYFSSYYYNVDRYSSETHYLSKTLGQKARALISDPYNPEFDQELPPGFVKPDLDKKGILKDPVKEALAALQELKVTVPSLTFQDVEMSGALLRLELIRQEENVLYPSEMKRELTHVSYLASFPEKNPHLSELLLQPSVEDLTYLYRTLDRMNDEEGKKTFFANAQIKKVQPTSDLWPLAIDFLPPNTPFKATLFKREKGLSHLVLPSQDTKELASTIERRGSRLFYKIPGEPEIPLAPNTPLFIQGRVDFEVLAKSEDQKTAFSVKGPLQNKEITGTLSLQNLKIAKAAPHTEFSTAPTQVPLWPFYQQKEGFQLPKMGEHTGVLLAKSFQENGVKLGDMGTLSYSSPTLSGTKEMRLPIYVAGFYDPGIMAVGNKCILVPAHITQSINASDGAFTLERSEANHFFVWFNELKEAPKLKQALLQKLEDKGVGKYWTVQTFHEYDFAKDLLQQFQSDKYLFSLIGIIILLVACTNIISLLVLLVSDKKKEIGILLAMGAKRRSIGMIFALCGASLGFFSCMLGLLLAFITLKNIDGVVYLLSLLQGHEAFNAQFFGQSLPHEITPRALLFAAIATPVLSLLAGLIPAIKAARLDPCKILRSE